MRQCNNMIGKKSYPYCLKHHLTDEQKRHGLNSAKRRWLGAISGMVVALVTAMIVIPCHATTIRASGITLEGGETIRINTTAYPDNAVITIKTSTSEQCDLKNYIKTSIAYLLSGNVIGNIVGEGDIAIPSHTTASGFRVTVTAAGRPFCSGTATVRVVIQRNNSEIGSADIPIKFVGEICSIDVNTSPTIPVLHPGSGVGITGIISNPVGAATVTFKPGMLSSGMQRGILTLNNDGSVNGYYAINNTPVDSNGEWVVGSDSNPRLRVSSVGGADAGEMTGFMTATIACP